MKNKQKDKQNKICGICRNEIKTGEEFVELNQFDSHWNLFKTGFYHVLCFKNRYILNKSTEKEVFNLINKTNQLLNDSMGIRA